MGLDKHRDGRSAVTKLSSPALRSLKGVVTIVIVNCLPYIYGIENRSNNVIDIRELDKERTFVQYMVSTTCVTSKSVKSVNWTLF